MTVERLDLTLRPITGPDEIDLFNRLPYVLNREVTEDLAAGRRQPGWIWLALHHDRVVARLAWWSRAGDPAPFLMDIFDLDDSGADGIDTVDAGTRLLRAAHTAVLPDGVTPPEYLRFVPPDWHDDPDQRRAVHARMNALERTGARPFVERLRLEWTQDTGVPPAGGRLVFHPADDRGELVRLMTRVLEGTLDAHSRADLTRMSAGDAAIAQYEEELVGYPSPRDWWRIATLPDGEPVGFVIPARNDYNAIIAYIGVVPGHRGHGYIDDILAEGTRILAEQRVTHIRASTDVGNVPMARAFARAGYGTFEREVTMVWPAER